LTLFVDTSVWFAAHVLIECWRLLNSRVHRLAAENFWRGIRRGIATLEKVNMADLETAWVIGEAFPDQDFSIVDRTSFAAMERLGITRVASFDNHFAVYRYGRNRDRAFEVLR
jgi:predicted nucleic acid-binding protein